MIEEKKQARQEQLTYGQLDVYFTSCLQVNIYFIGPIGSTFMFR